MRVCYLISDRGLPAKGAGGHAYSLRTTVQALCGKFDCSVVEIGPNVCPIAESSSRHFHHVYFNGMNVISAIRQLSSICNEQRYDLFHAFDSNSYFFARMIARKQKKPVVVTKCGGPSPHSYYHHAKYLIVYNSEDEAYFRSRAKFGGSAIYLIPNRVSRPMVDRDAVKELRSALDPDKVVFVRINRFSRKYASAMLQCTRLIARLNADGHECQLLLIGGVQDWNVFDEIKRYQSDVVRLIIEEKYTQNAARLLDIADFVIGTGRGLMEAASCGRVLLTPVAEGAYPVIVSSESFDQLFATNFSPRNRLADYDEEMEYRKVVRAVSDVCHRDSLKKQAEYFFNEFFCIESVVEKYCELYHTAVYTADHRPLDMLIHAASCLKSFRTAWGARFRSDRPSTVSCSVGEGG